MEKRLLIILLLLTSYASAVPFFQDSFESGDLSHMENSAAWTDSATTAVSADKAHTGTRSLKFTFAGSSSDGAWSEQRFTLGSAKRVTGNAATNNKVIRLWGEDYNEALKMGASFWAGSISLLQPDAYWTGWPQYLSCASDGPGPSDALPGSWTLTTEDLGKWHSFEFHFRPDDGSGNGAYEFWVDGEKKISHTALSYAGAPCSPGYFKNGYLLGWANSGFDQDTYIFIDDVAFSTSYIGAGGGTNPVCGSNGCESGETCSSCPQDCGTCPCNPNWICSDWSSCTNSQQSRTCSDSNGCGTTSGKPLTAQTCLSCTPITEICDNGVDEDCDGIDLVCPGRRITVDSTYSGYSTAVIDDGNNDAMGSTLTTWASDESTNPHWIELSLPSPTTVNHIDIYWAYNTDKGYYTSSQELQVQYWDGSQYVTVAKITNNGSVDKSSISFTKVSTTRLRLYQSANKGSAAYPTVLWVAEVDYGSCAHEADADCSGCVSQAELLAEISGWKRGDVSLAQLMGAISIWKAC
jgi:hypothetical protein